LERLPCPERGFQTPEEAEAGKPLPFHRDAVGFREEWLEEGEEAGAAIPRRRSSP